MSFWAVAQIQTQRENIADISLQRLGFETYLPRVRIRGRIIPLFPNYMFVCIVTTWSPVMHSIGVTKLIRNGDEPARLPEKVIDEIRARERNGLVQLPKAVPLGRAGQRVRILRGPFEGHIAALTSDMTDGERQRVLLNLLGRQTIIELPRADLSFDRVPPVSRQRERAQHYRR